MIYNTILKNGKNCLRAGFAGGSALLSCFFWFFDWFGVGGGTTTRTDVPGGGALTTKLAACGSLKSFRLTFGFEMGEPKRSVNEAVPLSGCVGESGFDAWFEEMTSAHLGIMCDSI